MKRGSALLLILAANVLIAMSGCDRQDNHWDAFDPEQKIVTVSVDTLNVVEGGAVDTLSVRLQMVPTDTVWVGFTAPAGQVRVTPAEAVFPPVDDDWARVVSLAVSAVDDAVDEAEHFDDLTVTVVSRDDEYDGQGGPALVPVRLTDNDGAGAYVSESSLTLVESEAGAVRETYRVRLLSEPTAPVVVQTMVTPTDPTFHVEPPDLLFDADNWNLEQEIRLWIDLDDVDNDDLSLTISHAAVSADTNYGEALVIPSVSVAVFDNTLPPIARLNLIAAGTDTLREADAGAGTVIEITLDKPSNIDVTVHLQTTDLSATGGSDYVALDHDIVFAVGAALSRQFTLSALDDAILEPREAFQVSITAVDNVIIGDDDLQVIQLLDDDTTELTVTAVPVNEDNGSVDFIVSLPQAELVPVAFTFVTGDVTATAGDDYEAVHGYYVLAVGEVQRTISVVLHADPSYEPDETFAVTLQNLSHHAVWNQGTVTGTILNDDPQAIVLGDIEVSESAGSAVFTLELEAPYDHPVTLNLSTVDGDGNPPNSGQLDAVGGQDFTTVANPAWLVPAGVTEISIPVPLLNDNVAEAASEYFRLSIIGADEPGFAGLQALCTLLDDDQPCLAVGDVLVDETAATATFTVELQSELGLPITSSADVEFQVTTRDQTADAGDDYVAVNQAMILIAGQSSIPVPVTLLDDPYDDDNETFILIVSEPVNAGGSCATDHAFCTLIDDEYPAINLTATQTRFNEGSTFEFSVRLSTPRQHATTYDLTLSAGNSEGNGVDYSFAAPMAQTIAPLVDEAQFTVLFLDDQLNGEPIEQIQIDISNANVALGVTTLTAEIVDAPELSITGAAAQEGETALFDVTVSAISTADIQFSVQFGSGTAVSGADFDINGTGPYTIGAGAAGTSVPVPLNAGDGGDWTTEDFYVTLIAPVNATNSPFNSGVGTITDTDPSPLSWAGTASSPEGGNVIFQVVLGWSSNADVQFSVQFTDGTANRAGIDYDDATVGPFTIGAGSMLYNLSVPTTADGAPELTVEDFNVTLASPLHAVIGAPAVTTGYIQDADQPELTITSTGPVTEGSDLLFDVSLSQQTIVPVTFSVLYDDGSTQGAGDYDGSFSGPFTLTPGQTGTTITVPTIDDGIHENQEIFIIFLAADPVNAVLGLPLSANGVINDDDP